MKRNTAILFIISSLISLLLAEGVLRLFNPIPNLAFSLDNELIYVPIKNSKQTFIRSTGNGGEKITSKFNSSGFRGEELLARENLGSTRIIVYGDSFILATFSHLKDTCVCVCVCL